MKLAILILSLIFAAPLSLFQQSNNYSLQLITDDKPASNSFSFWSEVRIYSKDTSFYYALHSRNPELIEGLKKGNYTVTITSSFNHCFSKKIVLDKEKTVKLKFKGLKNFYKKVPNLVTLSNRIKTNDTLYIAFTTQSLGIAFEKIGIVKKSASYKVLQFKGMQNEVFQEMEITEEQYKAVIKFELESKKLKAAETCHYVGLYTMELNKEIYSFEDKTCSWKGFDDLKASLFYVIGK